MTTQRAIAYIDGYNLYYSRLRGTTYKWLDLVALFREQILKPQLQESAVDQLHDRWFVAKLGWC